MQGSARKCLIIGIFVALTAFAAPALAALAPTPRLKPPAPEPIYLSHADYDRLRDIAGALKMKHFADARAETQLVKDPIAKSLGEWLYFKAQDPLVNIAEADAFLDAHSDWPAVSRIQSFVEGRIPVNAKPQTVLDFFATRDPITGVGRIRLASALYATGEKEAGDIHLREGWVNYNFSVSEERHILSAYGGRLTKADHAARVDRLLFARQVTNARRIFSKLDAADRRKAEARAALLMRAASAPRLYAALPHDDQLDPGVLLAAVRYYRRSGDEEKAIRLSVLAPNDPKLLRNPDRWWYERQLLMRWALKEGRFADAYALAARHSLDDPSRIAEAEFDAGWIALRFLNDPARAETHFLALASVVGTPISLSRAYYWLGRTATARHDGTLATSYYQKAAQYYYSYYGQLAAEELGGDALEQKFGPIVTPTPEDKATFSARPTVAALRMLSDLGLDYEFMIFSYYTDDLLERPGEYAELAALTNGQAAPHLTVRAGKVAIQRDAFAPNIAYPTILVPAEAKVFAAPEIILGLSRQESEFNPHAFSHAGARGVMQLMPSTALITARKEGIAYSRTALLDDPAYNMTIGAAHLEHLIDYYCGSLPLAFAAYNAGVNRADQWIEDYGDPRSANVDPVDWIELIPFSETRNYVQRVLENTQVYRGRLNDAPIPGELSADIERGGESGRIARTSIPSATLALRAADRGAQSVPPVPDSTIGRAATFRLAEAAKAAQTAELEPVVEASPPVEPTTAKPQAKEPRGRRRGRRTSPAIGARIVNAPRAETVSPEPAAPANAAETAPEQQQPVETTPIALSGDGATDQAASPSLTWTSATSEPQPSLETAAKDETLDAAPLAAATEESAPAPAALEPTSAVEDADIIEADANDATMAEPDPAATDADESETFETFGGLSEADMEALMLKARAQIAEEDITDGAPAPGPDSAAAVGEAGEDSLSPDACAPAAGKADAADLNDAGLRALQGGGDEVCGEAPASTH